MRRVDVEIPGTPYPVLIGRGCADLVGEHARGTVVVVADAVLTKLPETAAPVLRIKAGEEAKTLDRAGELLELFADARLGRDGTVVAVGGGTIGDLAGFAASIWLRGVRLIHVPTTLLAMVDSAIGGKTGVNSARAKNAIGTFWQPSAVLIDPEYLNTLAAGEVQAGMAEVLKYAMTMDPLLAALPLGDELIERCVTNKARVVAADVSDAAGREILNYGHTVAHGLEAASGYRLHHGRAVAAGMRAAARISARLGLCEESLVEQQDALLAGHGLPGPLPPLDLAAVISALESDKKVRAGELRWVLLREMGRAEPGHRVPAEIVRDAVAAILRH